MWSKLGQSSSAHRFLGACWWTPPVPGVYSMPKVKRLRTDPKTLPRTSSGNNVVHRLPE
jgi:hypothetical protein